SLVFYPSGTDWATSKAACYVQFRSDDPTVRDIKDQVEDTLRNLRNNGSPNAEARYIKTLTTQDASKAQVYYYTGDKFGNFEATAYIKAKNSIHFITLSAQDESSFKQAIPAFEAIVTSYENLSKVETDAAEAE
ncbi:MAG: hypothetical protein JO076_05315, partial [Verrucomicrobia bacterium]|nr:hypothetical protein [Verrucomicrobiota bacterium]